MRVCSLHAHPDVNSHLCTFVTWKSNWKCNMAARCNMWYIRTISQIGFRIVPRAATLPLHLTINVMCETRRLGNRVPNKIINRWSQSDLAQYWMPTAASYLRCISQIADVPLMSWIFQKSPGQRSSLNHYHQRWVSQLQTREYVMSTQMREKTSFDMLLSQKTCVFGRLKNSCECR